MNGSPRAVDDGASVSDLIDALGLGARSVVVELNGEPVARSAYDGTTLRPGDRVEVVRAVAGG